MGIYSTFSINHSGATKQQHPIKLHRLGLLTFFVMQDDTKSYFTMKISFAIRDKILESQFMLIHKN